MPLHDVSWCFMMFHHISSLKHLETFSWDRRLSFRHHHRQVKAWYLRVRRHGGVRRGSCGSCGLDAPMGTFLFGSETIGHWGDSIHSSWYWLVLVVLGVWRHLYLLVDNFPIFALLFFWAGLGGLTEHQEWKPWSHLGLDQYWRTKEWMVTPNQRLKLVTFGFWAIPMSFPAALDALHRKRRRAIVPGFHKKWLQALWWDSKNTADQW